jgi:spore germination protein YaaH
VKHFKLLLLAAGIIISPAILISCNSVPKNQEENDQIPFSDYSGFLPDLPLSGEDLPISSFTGVWAYLLAGRESSFKPGMPITDIGYFGAEIDSYGKLTDIPNPKKASSFGGRLHMVVACNGRALSHFVLVPSSAERKTLITDLIAAAKNFDGLQIDFENIPQRDAVNFLSFLAELRSGLPDKIFTVALPARTKTLNNDIYDYAKIKPLVDQILVMAYDEHWSTSAPGPIASLDWCKNVAEYSLRIIGNEKLVMGIPFYGRAWGKTNPSRAHLYSGIETILKDHEDITIRRDKGIPTFNYEENVAVTVYYEDDYSLSARMEMYRAMGVNAIGFWRLGQETQAVWDILRIEP